MCDLSECFGKETLTFLKEGEACLLLMLSNNVPRLLQGERMNNIRK